MVARCRRHLLRAAGRRRGRLRAHLRGARWRLHRRRNRAALHRLFRALAISRGVRGQGPPETLSRAHPDRGDRASQSRGVRTDEPRERDPAPVTDAPPSAASPVAPDAFRRFWHTGRGYWFSLNGGSLIGLLVVIVVLQLLMQYRLNLWNRDFFNALGARAAGEIWHETRMLLVLVAASVTLSVTAVW